MAKQISNSVVNALGMLVDDVPYYVTMVDVEQEQYFIILGKTKFYFVDSNLRESTDDSARAFKYSCVEKIRCDRKRRNLLQLILREDDQNDGQNHQHRPVAKNVYTQDR